MDGRCRLPEACECGAQFTIEHALSCKKGGFVSIRHNELRNFTAKLLRKVCHDVKIEPSLEELSGEVLSKSSNISTEARLDISARGFWETHQKAFFDVRVFNPLARRYVNLDPSKSYEINEKEKKRCYNQRVMEIEHGSFTPLVFSATGGYSRECRKFYKRLSAMIAEKEHSRYSDVITHIYRKINFALLRSIIICVRGSRSVSTPGNEENAANFDIRTSEQLVRMNI